MKDLFCPISEADMFELCIAQKIGGQILTNSINLHCIILLSVINQLKSSKLVCRGHVAHLKTTFNGKLSEQIVSFMFKNQLVSLVLIFLFLH